MHIIHAPIDLFISHRPIALFPDPEVTINFYIRILIKHETPITDQFFQLILNRTYLCFTFTLLDHNKFITCCILTVLWFWCTTWIHPIEPIQIPNMLILLQQQIWKAPIIKQARSYKKSLVKYLYVKRVGKGDSLIRVLRSTLSLKAFKWSNLISKRSAPRVFAFPISINILSTDSAIIGAQIRVELLLTPLLPTWRPPEEASWNSHQKKKKKKIVEIRQHSH